jgi:predicted site-specific integrase-resolvase
MEIINVEKKTFEEMLAHVDMLNQKMQRLYHLHADRKMKKWYDKQDVCQILRISQRTLQQLRDNGTLGYTQINHKMFYKPEDVERLLRTARIIRSITNP